MATIDIGTTLRYSDPAAGSPHFSLKGDVTGAPGTLPATLSGTTPVPAYIGSLTVQVLEDQVTAATYQAANPTVAVGHP